MTFITTEARRLVAVVLAIALTALVLIAVPSATASAQPLPPPVAGSGAKALPTRTDTWMRDFGDVLGQRRVRDVVFPGTHDSATSELDGGTMDDQKALEWARFFDFFLPDQWNEDWSIAQDQTVLQQLKDGIRQFDLRFCTEPGHDPAPIRACHGALGEDMETTLRQIAEFLSDPAHHKEILIVGIRLEQFDHSEWRRAQSLVDRYLGNRLINSALAYRDQVTVNDLWATGRQVILLSDDLCTNSGPPASWASAECRNSVPVIRNTFYGPWNWVYDPQNGGARKDYSEKDLLNHHMVIERMGKALESRWVAGPEIPFRALLVVGTAKTPSSEFVHERAVACTAGIEPFPCTLLEMGLQGASRVNLLLSWWAKNEHHARSRMNIISVDNYDDTNVVQAAILMNTGPVQSSRVFLNKPPSPIELGYQGKLEGTLKREVSCTGADDHDFTVPKDDPILERDAAITDDVVASTASKIVSASYSVNGGPPTQAALDGGRFTLDISLSGVRNATIGVWCTDEYGKQSYVAYPPPPVLDEIDVIAPDVVTAGETFRVSSRGRYGSPGWYRLSGGGITYTMVSNFHSTRCDGDICRAPAQAGELYVASEVSPNLVAGNTGVVKSGLKGAATVRVIPAGSNRVAFSWSTYAGVAGTPQRFPLYSVDAYGNRISDVTASARIVVDGPTPLTAENTAVHSCPATACTLTKAGNYRISAHVGDDLVATASLSILPGPAVAYELDPVEASVTAGRPQQYTVYGFDMYGNRFNSTDHVSIYAGGQPCGVTAQCTLSTAGRHRVEVRKGSASVAQGWLTVTPAKPTVIIAYAGSGQTARPGAAFTPFVAKLRGADGNPVAGSDVTFRVDHGSATFDGATTATVKSRADGLAVSPKLTAGSTIGPVVITATSAAAPALPAAVFTAMVH